MKTPAFFRDRLNVEDASSTNSTQSVASVFTDVLSEPFVRGLLHRPAKPNGSGLVLTHGAGSNCQAPLLVGLAEAFAQAGYFVLRIDLPFRQDRPYGPPGPHEAKRDRAGLKNAITALRKMTTERIFIGGHSYGGRQASMLCAEDPEAAPALLLLSYPLHPPRKPEQLRTQHFSNLYTPSLFVHGTRDAFATIGEMEQALKSIPARTKLLAAEGVGHDLGFKGKAKGPDLPSSILSEFQTFLAA